MSERQSARYPGNLGIVELAEFWQKATPSQSKQMDRLLQSNKIREAWAFLQKVTGKTLEPLHGMTPARAASHQPICTMSLQARYGWITPEGQLVPINTSHLRWAEKYLAAENLPDVAENAQKTLLQMGWVRVVAFRDFEVDRGVPISKAAMKTIVDSVVECISGMNDKEFNRFVDEYTGERIRIYPIVNDHPVTFVRKYGGEWKLREMFAGRDTPITRVAKVLSPDDYLYTEDGQYVWTTDRAKEAWAITLRLTKRYLSDDRYEKLVLLVGIPASGKSTWLKTNREPNALYIDATFTRPDWRKPFIEEAMAVGKPVEAVVMTTPVYVCIDRNKCRTPDRQVPDDVIMHMHTTLGQNMPSYAEGFSRITRVGQQPKQASALEVVRSLRNSGAEQVEQWPPRSNTWIYQKPNGTFVVFKSLNWDTIMDYAKTLFDARKLAEGIHRRMQVRARVSKLR